MGGRVPRGTGTMTGFSTSHSTLPERFLHICTWCVYKFRRSLPHKEQNCIKKQKYLDKNAAAVASSANTSVSVIEVVSSHTGVQCDNCAFADAAAGSRTSLTFLPLASDLQPLVYSV